MEEYYNERQQEELAYQYQAMAQMAIANSAAGNVARPQNTSSIEDRSGTSKVVDFVKNQSINQLSTMGINKVVKAFRGAGAASSAGGAAEASTVAAEGAGLLGEVGAVAGAVAETAEVAAILL